MSTQTLSSVRVFTYDAAGNRISMGNLQPYVFLNISTPEADGTYSDHEVALLEEDGRVYVYDFGFDQYMQDVHPEITEPFIERKYFFLFLLYDFTLDVGDRYPCRGEVYVERTGRHF